ncbi:related to single-stranded DNA-binding replication A (RPA), large (70 kD) subunit and related [Lecanosticta acicola]|uniref:Replication protein A subunit n=1 Tax=Lecanosticta acicola TaxID=111012 RepID=A0AAI9EDK9_9PEZI|nr:related to single-stranded DNA-binding replication A (RPA), large (70 kD) subunit and related [Lecanosticta acicola]
MTDALGAITIGALKSITEGVTIDNPILQCVQIKPMANNNNGQERWRIVFNDTVNFIQGMIAIQSNHLITDGKLKKGSVCRLTQYQANFVKDKYILIVISLDVLEEYGEPDKLGQPVALESTEAKQEQQEDVKPQPGNIAGNNFYGNKPQIQQQQQPQRSLPSRPNGASHGGSHGNITPIEAISPYTHKWTIKARCTHKGDIRTWHNKNGEGKLFSANFLDDSGEIRATMFNDAVDQWYDVLQEGAVYYISSPCRVQLAKKQFSNLNNDYELAFERDTQVEKAEDNDGVPQVSYNFTTLAALQNVEKDTTTDILGVLQDVGEVSEIVSKNSGKPFSKRELTLVDDTGYTIRLTVWGKTAESFEVPVESVIAFKGVRVSDFGGRSLSLSSSGTMNANPEIEEAYKLKGWYEGQGRHTEYTSHANTMSTVTSGGRGNDAKTIAQIRDENIGMGEETEWFSLKATIIYIKQDSFAYPACRTTDPAPCNKKVQEESEGQWRCEKCNKVWDAPNYRYIMSVNVSDHTGQIWLSCFDEVGATIMGMQANQLMQLKEEGDDKRVTETFGDANCQTFVFRCRAKMDTFNDQQRVRYQVQYANPLNFSVEAKKLADIIKQYNIQDESLFVS